jgi:hypothetical protein
MAIANRHGSSSGWVHPHSVQITAAAWQSILPSNGGHNEMTNKISRSRWLGREIGILLILSAGYGLIHIATNLSHLMGKN